MNPQDLCKELKSRYNSQLDYFVEGKAFDEYEPTLDDVLTDKWLEDSISKVVEATGTPTADFLTLLGPQESVAFLAAYQKTKLSSAAPRVQRWASRIDSLKQNAEVTLTTQLPGVGFKLDEEYITRLGG